MARAKSTDFLHNFRFHVVVTGFGQTGNTSQLGTNTAGTVDAGFNACSVPELTQEAVEYREGHYIYGRKFVGLPTVSDITLSRGVALGDSTFWKWTKDVAEANNEYRASVDIYHYHRDAKPAAASTPPTPQMQVQTKDGFRVYHCYECFPIRNKIAADLDSTASEISIQEMDLAVEYFDIETKRTV